MNHGFTPAIWFHLVTALAALALGASVFLARKGTRAHRLAGRSWAAVMLATIAATWWIRGDGSFSWIHLLSVLTLVMLVLAVFFAITHRVRAHRKMVIGLYAGSLVIAGLFTLLPERLLGRMLWSALGVI